MVNGNDLPAFKVMEIPQNSICLVLAWSFQASPEVVCCPLLPQLGTMSRMSTVRTIIFSPLTLA